MWSERKLVVCLFGGYPGPFFFVWLLFVFVYVFTSSSRYFKTSIKLSSLDSCFVVSFFLHIDWLIGGRKKLEKKYGIPFIIIMWIKCLKNEMKKWMNFYGIIFIIQMKICRKTTTTRIQKIYSRIIDETKGNKKNNNFRKVSRKVFFFKKQNSSWFLSSSSLSSFFCFARENEKLESNHHHHQKRYEPNNKYRMLK